MLAWARLLRLSLMPSALADVIVGLALGGQTSWPGGGVVFGCLVASLGIYHGGLALNDWADRDHDLATRPERPLPSGAVSERAALIAALVLLGVGILAAISVHPRLGLWMGLVALAAASYDLAGRGPWLGPVLLGLCRAGNLGMGLMASAWLAEQDAPPADLMLAPLLYGVYVFAVSRLGRLEDGEEGGDLDRKAPARLIKAALCLALVPLLGLLPSFRPNTLNWVLSAIVAWVAAAGLWKIARAEGPWTRGRIGGSMGASLRRLLAFTAAVGLLVPDQLGVFAALLALLGYPLSHALRRIIPPS